MDMTPMYDLRDRLRTAMIAGTNLLAEDFRLKRAVEALAPLEKAAPVFAKMGELSRSLTAPGDADDKEGILLDAITLVDAVCCTQGAVGVSGELVPIFAEDADFEAENASGSDAVSNSSKAGPGMVLSNVPYSTLNPLQEALTTSGSGHYSFVQECHREHPEIFKDYRVRAAMVQALGASYGELADNVCDWLLEDGADVVPLLMRGFDPKGKKEMVRRVQIIDQWMGGQANDFYVEQLKEAEGEVRQKLIFALRHSPENIELLDGMRKTEKGNARKAACYALACNDNEKVQAIFEEMYRKKPLDVMEFLQINQAPWAERLAARGVREQLLAVLEKNDSTEKDTKEKGTEKEKNIEQKKRRETFEKNFGEKMVETKYIGAMEYALFGKGGPEVCDVIRSTAKHAGKFGAPLHGGVLWTVCGSMIYRPEEDLLGLAISLYEGPEGNMKFFPAAFLAKLIAGDGADWIDWLETQLFGKNSALPYHFLSEALKYLQFDETAGTYFLRFSIFSEADARDHVYTLPVRLEVKGRFLELLLRCGDGEIDKKLANLFDPADREVCARLEEYFYKKAAASRERSFYLNALKRCGCTRCEGLLVHYAQARKVSIWELEYYVQEMPGTPEAKIAEASRIPDLVKSGKVKVSNWNEQNYMRWIQNCL